MFALIDCNNFYASCEIAFQPKLKNKPLVVLSNNDGCVIARSKEAKKMNIKMGEPIFKYSDLVYSNVLRIFSSNFTLYGDMSSRVMKTLLNFGYDMEIYSIDEAFLDLSDIEDSHDKNEFLNLAKSIKSKVYKWTGIEVSVGISKTKTLAKLACEIAKNEKGYTVLTDKIEINQILKKTYPQDIWGIGRNLKKSLFKIGIYSAYDLAYTDETILQKHLSINVVKTSLELKQIKSFDCETTPATKKSICSSRSFKNKIDNFDLLSQKIASFVEIAAKKLRSQKMHTNFISIFITTSFHSKDLFYSNSAQITLPKPTSYTPDLISYAKRGLKQIFKKGYLYKKAGIILSDFTDENFSQGDFFTKLNSTGKTTLMKVIDKINHKGNKNAVFFAARGIDKKYTNPSKIGSSDKKSPIEKSKRYTTNFDELLKVF